MGGFRLILISYISLHLFLCCSAGKGAGAAGAAGVVTGITNEEYKQIIDQCFYYLEQHLCEGTKWELPYHFYRPSLEKYSPDQWLWDSGSHQIVWANRNVTNSVLDLRTMLQLQQPDGRIPEEIFWSDRTPKENAEILLQYSNTKCTDTTQMPVLPYSLKAIYQQTQDKTLLKEFLYPLVAYFDWWRSTRDLGDGLVVIIHNWESGLDASPAYDPAFNVYVTELNEKAFLSIYSNFLEIVESYRFLYKWNTTEILARTAAPDQPDKIDTWFMVKDCAVNSVYASGWAILGDLAKEIGDDQLAERCKQEYKISSDAIVTKMWDSDKSRFNSLYIDPNGEEKASIANTVQNLFPLLLSDLSDYHVEKIVDELSDPKKFFSNFPIPTVSLDDPQFSPTFDVDLMWRGPVWGFTNWFLLEGLELHGRIDLQEILLKKWIALVQVSGIYEHYNPLTGEAYGAEGLGMSTLVCDWIYKKGWYVEGI